MPYSTQFIIDIDRTITRGRLARYLTATAGDVSQALQLYEKNVALSETLFGVLHGLEVALRNSIHPAMTTDMGVQDWYLDGLQLPRRLYPVPQSLSFTAPMSRMIAEARSYARAGAPIGKVVAELTFGFWPGMLSSRFDALWTPTLHKAFPAATKPRRVIHWRFRTIQCLRNRIAHHEPILTSTNAVRTGFNDQKTITLPEILEAVKWISPPTADWLCDTTRYDIALALLAEVAVSGLTL